MGEGGAAQQQRGGRQGVGVSPRPYDDDKEAGGAGNVKRLSFRVNSGAAVPAAAARVGDVDAVEEEEDGRPESVDPALARSYDARQVCGFIYVYILYMYVYITSYPTNPPNV